MTGRPLRLVITTVVIAASCSRGPSEKLVIQKVKEKVCFFSNDACAAHPKDLNTLRNLVLEYYVGYCDIEFDEVSVSGYGGFVERLPQGLENSGYTGYYPADVRISGLCKRLHLVGRADRESQDLPVNMKINCMVKMKVLVADNGDVTLADGAPRVK